MNSLPALLGNDPIFDKKVPLAKPVLPDLQIFAEELEPIFRSGILTKGAHLRRFEEMVAEHLGVKHAVGVSSCTAGLMLTYRALDLSGEVIVPSFTFMATVGALAWLDLKPVFVDVDPATTTIDVSAVEAAITSRTTAIVAVHNFGNPADIHELEKIAGRYGLRLIFDAAHAFGALCDGRPVGPQGDAQVFSLSPTKLLIAGEGGIVATNDDVIAEKIRLGREYGNDGNYDGIMIGLNARMPEINALLGQHSLRNLESAAQHRNDLAATYREHLRHLPGLNFQEVRAGNRSAYFVVAITVNPESFGLSRDELAQVLEAENIDARTYYNPPVHRQSAYRHFAAPGINLAHTDQLSATILCLPIWSNMDRSVVEKICLAIERAHRFGPEIKARLGASTLALV
jgi:dTDP-4-amino-4,6-dideoxygalactose transaminase